MDEGQQEFVRSAYTFSAKLNEHAEKPKYLPLGSRANLGVLSQWLVLCANVVHAFAEAAEIEFGRAPDPDPAPPGRARHK